MSLTKALFDGLDRVATFLAFLSGGAVLVLAVLITADVIARKLFSVSLQGTDEIGGYVLAMVGSLGMVHVLNRRGFTRIDLLFKFLPVWIRRALHVLAYLSLAGVVVFFAMRSLDTLNETLLFDSRSMTPLQTPMWIPQGLWSVGMVFFAVMAVLHALRASLLVFLDPAQIERDYGATQLEEEVDEYTSRPEPDVDGNTHGR
jgi:TRAP-type C4-dicarboxylate transport system permease small subunit